MQNNSIHQTSLSKKLFNLPSFCGMVMAPALTRAEVMDRSSWRDYNKSTLL
jgi:hypothetical protein